MIGDIGGKFQNLTNHGHFRRYYNTSPATMSGYQQKRKYNNNQQHDFNSEEIADDLAFAATFALVYTPDIPEPPTQKPPQAPTDNIDIDEDDSSDDDDDSSDEKNQIRDTDAGPADDDSDDESDIDLSEQLAKMEEDDAPKKGSQNSRIVVPTTQNEIDLYNCPVAELEKKLDINLGVSDVLIFQPSDAGVMNAKVSLDRIRLAGVIKFHLVADRTIVVESIPDGGMAVPEHMVNTPGSLLLDEGSLLLLKLVKNDEITAKIVGDVALEANEICVIPLGKILEVFGPVSKPLYTMRLTKTSVPKKKPVVSKDERKPEVSEEGEEKDAEETKEEGGKEEAKDDAQPDDSSKEESKKEPEITSDKSMEETKTAKPQQKMSDPWSIDGVLTQWVKSNPMLEVYYSEDQVKMVDTQTVVRNSRKGCGKFFTALYYSTIMYVLIHKSTFTLISLLHVFQMLQISTTRRSRMQKKCTLATTSRNASRNGEIKRKTSATITMIGRVMEAVNLIKRSLLVIGRMVEGEVVNLMVEGEEVEGEEEEEAIQCITFRHHSNSSSSNRLHIMDMQLIHSHQDNTAISNNSNSNSNSSNIQDMLHNHT